MKPVGSENNTPKSLNHSLVSSKGGLSLKLLDSYRMFNNNLNLAANRDSRPGLERTNSVNRGLKSDYSDRESIIRGIVSKVYKEFKSKQSESNDTLSENGRTAPNLAPVDTKVHERQFSQFKKTITYANSDSEEEITTIK